MMIIITIVEVILIIVLLFIAILLFVPFKYILRGKIDDSIQGDAEIKWILGMFRLIITKTDSEPQIKIIICGLNIVSKKISIEPNSKKISTKNKKSRAKILKKELFIYIKEMFEDIKPKIFKIHGIYGFEDHSITGMILGVTSVVQAVVPKAQIQLTPSFDEEIFHVECETQGDLKVYRVAFKTIKYFIKNYTKKKSKK